MEASAGPRVSWSQTQLIKLILSARKNESAAGWRFSLKGVNWLALCPGPLGPLGSRGVTVYRGWEMVRDLGPRAVLGGRCDCLTFHRVGEGRACWSLGNAYVSMGSPAQALTFAKKHLQISQEVSWAHSPRPLLVPQQPVVSFLGVPHWPF